MVAGRMHNVEKLCTRIYSDCNSLESWKWDDRFQTVLSEFSADQEEEVVTVLEKHFDSCWDEETIQFAPGKIKSVARGLGEVRNGQKLYTSDPDLDEIVIGAFWPWQNGKKISLRILVDVPVIELGAGAPESESIQSPLYS